MRTTALATGERSCADACADLARDLAQRGFFPGSGPDDGVLLAYFPLARRNPFQGLLYGRALEHGVAVLPVRDWRSFATLPWPGRAVCHLHWVNSVLAGAEGAGEADRRIAEFAAELDHLQRQGRHVVWTVHNALPHDALLPDKEAELRRVIVEHADVVHVMAPDTAALVGDRFAIPASKVRVVPHPSYQGVYPDFVSRATARSELGIGDDEFALLLFGSIQPYKGVDRLLRSFEELADDQTLPRRPVLLIAGQPSDVGLEREIRDWARTRTDVRCALRAVPTDDVQLWFRAADVSVLPYREVLNSGSAMLSLTFGLPFVAPSLGAFCGLAARFDGICYDHHDPDGLTLAMAAAVTAGWRLPRDIGALLADHAPARVSDLFFRELLDGIGARSR